MNNTLTELSKSVRKKVVETVTDPKNIRLLMAAIISKNAFEITIYNTPYNEAYGKLLKLVETNCIFTLTSRYTTTDSPRKREDIVTLHTGQYWVRIGRHVFLFSVGQEKLAVMDSIKARNWSKYISITGLKSSRHIIDQLVRDSYDEDVFLPYIHNNGSVIGLIEKRYGHQRQFVKSEIYKEIDDAFDRIVNDPKYYDDNDLPRKETFLLYGPPGTGKSTIARHFASKYDLNIHVATPHTIQNIDTPLLGDPFVVLLEDIDAFESILKDEFKTKSTTKDAQSDYSRFINYLDGVVPLKNVIVIMTTNFKERLLDSVTRIGRVDHLLHLGRYSYEEILKYCGWGRSDKRSKYVKTLDLNMINVAVLKKLTLCDTVEECKEVIRILRYTVKVDETVSSMDTTDLPEENLATDKPVDSN